MKLHIGTKISLEIVGREYRIYNFIGGTAGTCPLCNHTNIAWKCTWHAGEHSLPQLLDRQVSEQGGYFHD